MGRGSGLHITVLFTFVSQGWAAVRIARPVALKDTKTEKYTTAGFRRFLYSNSSKFKVRL